MAGCTCRARVDRRALALLTRQRPRGHRRDGPKCDRPAVDFPGRRSARAHDRALHRVQPCVQRRSSRFRWRDRPRCPLTPGLGTAVVSHDLRRGHPKSAPDCPNRAHSAYHACSADAVHAERCSGQDPALNLARRFRDRTESHSSSRKSLREDGWAGAHSYTRPPCRRSEWVLPHRQGRRPVRSRPIGASAKPRGSGGCRTL